MSTAHTPGPWKAQHWEIRTESPGSAVIAVLHGEYEANARLIAAAPEMLEALQIAEVIAARAVKANQAPEGALRTIRAAIAKATGAQP